jgi:hypothetical protein
MKLKTLLEAAAKAAAPAPAPEEDGSARLGRAVGQAMADVKRGYNSLNALYVVPGDDDLTLNFVMYAGSNVPVATFLRKRFKENGLAAKWQFARISDPVDHDYEFTLPAAPGLNKKKFLAAALAAANTGLDERDVPYNARSIHFS